MKKIFLMINAIFFWSTILSAHGVEHKTVSETDLFSKTNSYYKEKVEPIFRQKCFDCHSTQTQYPWYYKIPIVKSILDSDIQEGMEHMDMTDGFPFKGHHSLSEQLEGIENVVAEGSMPPWLYRLGHKDSSLTEEEKQVILEWIHKMSLYTF